LPREVALFAIILALIALLQLRTGDFLTGPTLGNLMSDSVLLGCVAAGAGLVILAGGIDISLGSLMALSATIAGTLWARGTPWPAVIAVALLVGAGGGFLNAAMAHLGRIHPIVVTLGTMSVYRGLTRWWMRQDIQIPGATRKVLFGEGDAAPPVVWLGVALFVLLAVMLHQTMFGRSLFAVGGNPHAAQRVGLAPARVWLKAFTLQGALAGLAGILFLARSGSLQTTSYEDKTLQAISAAVVGGVAITGGRGSIFGVLLGCVLLGLLTMACQFLHVSTDWQQAAVGSVLVIAVTVDALWRRRA
jgi:rhamnose transport system permease protein